MANPVTVATGYVVKIKTTKNKFRNFDNLNQGGIRKLRAIIPSIRMVQYVKNPLKPLMLSAPCRIKFSCGLLDFKNEVNIVSFSFNNSILTSPIIEVDPKNLGSVVFVKSKNVLFKNSGAKNFPMVANRKHNPIMIRDCDLRKSRAKS